MSTKRVSFGSKPKGTQPPVPDANAWVGKPSTPATGVPEGMKRLTIDIPEDLHRELKVTAAMNGTKMADMVREWIEQGIKYLKK